MVMRLLGAPQGTATESAVACVADGCYTLTMTDQYGDGMCCTYGDGSYTLTDADGNVLASGGDFAASLRLISASVMRQF